MRTTRTFVGRFLTGLLCCAALGAAQFDEYGLKGAFVYNFIQFVEWPESKLAQAAPLAVCVVGESPVAAKLGAISGQEVRGHPIRLRTGASTRNLDDCHVAYVPDSYGQQLPDIVERHARSGVLFITEGSSLASRAVIGLVIVDDRMTFEINLDLAARQGLTISSKLLRLARRVHGSASVGPPRALLSSDHGAVATDEER